MQLNSFDRSKHVYKNDAFVELVKDAVRFFNGTPVQTLPPSESFLGTGVYAIYYIGDNTLYKKYSDLNRLSYDFPIYVGKAVPSGWRQARVADSAQNQSKELYRRLREHSRSISAGSDLEVKHFMCRFVIFEDSGSDMISTIEAALIKLNRPLWNVAVDGFGNHDPGKGRYEQAKSDWDVIHNGRNWANKCNGIPKPKEQILKNIQSHLNILRKITMNSLEIFSGAGGLAKGLEIAGFKHTSFVELNKDACTSLRLNFNPNIVFEGDITRFDLTNLQKIDLVAGGPPCQPFSLGGKHNAHNDHRDMFPHAIKAIEKLQPKAFIFENVKGLLRDSFNEYFSYIILRLTYPDYKIYDNEDWRDNLNRLKKINSKNYEGVKYNVAFKLLNAANYGIPQKRERVVIIGTQSNLNIDWIFPKPTHSEDRLLWDKYVTGEYWDRHNLPIQKNEYYDKNLLNKYGMFPPEESPWQTVRDCLKCVPHPLETHSIEDHIFRDGAKVYPGHTGSEIDQPSKTIKAGGHGVPGGENMIRYEDGSVRYFTVHEAKLIQTFPKNYIISGSWGEAMRQIGNAVPVELARIIGNQLYKLINSDEIAQSVSNSYLTRHRSRYEHTTIRP